MVGTVLGGIGLFLLGMSLMTDGLQHAAGDALRVALRRYTRTRWSSVLAGAISTAVVQSSSATTLATIGFVGAGLLPFAAAIGVVFGANVGTTLTAWLVGAVGLKVSVSAFALPLVGIGAMVKVFLRSRRAALGMALAGFGLVFVGIDVLQQGMQAVSQVMPMPSGTGGFGGTMLLVLTGLVMTVVMQSSSAAVATTLAAVHAGTIGLEQAAAMVIGQNVGTTVTAAIGAMGGAAPVRRIAMAHAVFNAGTGIVALAMLPLFGAIASRAFASDEPAVAIAAFHTAFNVLGLLLFVPFTERLAHWLERVIPEKGDELTRRLRVGVGAPAATILEAARLTAQDILGEGLAGAIATLAGTEDSVPRRTAILRGLDATRERLTGVATDPHAPETYRLHLATLHAVDHLYRLEEALGETEHIASLERHDELQAAADALRANLEQLMPDHPEAVERIEQASTAHAAARRAVRSQLLERTARGELEPADTERILEAWRWVDRIGYHLWRAFHHLAHADRDLPHPQPPAPMSEGRRGDESHELER